MVRQGAKNILRSENDPPLLTSLQILSTAVPRGHPTGCLSQLPSNRASSSVKDLMPNFCVVLQSLCESSTHSRRISDLQVILNAHKLVMPFIALFLKVSS
jgi:hypothetical protein